MNQNNFLQTLNENFAKLDTFKKELFILGNFSPNSYQNEDHAGCKAILLCRRQFLKMSRTIFNFTLFGLTQIIKYPNGVTWSSKSLTDHILAILREKISHEGVINDGLSYHQLIYCIRKVSRIKTGGVHKKLNSVHLKITRFMLIKRSEENKFSKLRIF